MNRSLAAHTDMSGVAYPDYVSIEETPEGEVVFHTRGAAGEHHASVKMSGEAFATLVCQTIERASPALREHVIQACLDGMLRMGERMDGNA